MLNSTGGIKWSKYYRYTTDYTHTWFHRIYVDPGNKIYTVGTIWSKTDNLYHAMLARMNYSGAILSLRFPLEEIYERLERDFDFYLMLRFFRGEPR